MINQLKDDIWEGLILSDYRTRYYRIVAETMGRRERLTTYIAAGFALLTLVFELSPIITGTLITASIILTAAAAVIPIMYRRTNRIAAVSYYEHRLAKNHDNWKVLWQDCHRDSYDSNMIQEHWKRLRQEMTEISAMEANEQIFKKARKEAQDATTAFFPTVVLILVPGQTLNHSPQHHHVPAHLLAHLPDQIVQILGRAEDIHRGKAPCHHAQEGPSTQTAAS